MRIPLVAGKTQRFIDWIGAMHQRRDEMLRAEPLEVLLELVGPVTSAAPTSRHARLEARHEVSPRLLAAAFAARARANR